MRMTRFLTSLSVVLVGMDFVLQLVLMGISFTHFDDMIIYRNPLLTLYFAGVFKCSNIFRVFGCTTASIEATTLEASRNPMRYIYMLCLLIIHIFPCLLWPRFGLLPLTPSVYMFHLAWVDCKSKKVY
jgi:hypothetical protein